MHIPLLRPSSSFPGPSQTRTRERIHGLMGLPAAPSVASAIHKTFGSPKFATTAKTRFHLSCVPRSWLSSANRVEMKDCFLLGLESFRRTTRAEFRVENGSWTGDLFFVHKKKLRTHVTVSQRCGNYCTQRCHKQDRILGYCNQRGRPPGQKNSNPSTKHT
jgi:hypothetical protein